MATDDSDPPRVTAMTQGKNDPARLTVYVNGQRAGVLLRRQAEALGIAIGSPWRVDLAQRVGAAVAEEDVFLRAMKWLNRRALSAVEVKAKLRTLAVEEQTAAAVIARLQGIGAVDDQRLGRTLIEQTTRAKPAGPALLRHKLQARGLADETIDALLEQHTADDNAALAFARKQLSAITALDARTRYRRLAAALTRRGFEHDAIVSTLDRLGLSAEDQT